MIMSRRRLLLVWTILFIVVILVCIYLPYHVSFKAWYPVISSITIPSKNNDQKIHILTTSQQTTQLRTSKTHPKKPTTIRSPKPTTIRLPKPTTIQLAKPTTAAPTKPKLCEPELLVGAVYCNKTVPQMQEVIGQLSVDHGGFVRKGGAFKPTGCIAKDKLAIIIPYRNRSEHLRIFLRHMHPILQRQMHDYRIIVVEQAGNYSFNRAQLINIGFLEALKIKDFGCFVFHDVDHILENDKNDYGCPESPRLLGVSVDRFNRRFPYLRYFGGVGSFSKDQFEKINGYSNMFWGWGGEDDDAYNRIRGAGYSLSRPRADVGRYMMLKEHHFRDKPGGNRHMLLKTSTKRMYTDGLNSVIYEVLKKTELSLYTHILVKLHEELDITRNATDPIPTTVVPI